MNFELPYIPSRPVKPREHGVTMVMDKGLSIRQAENLIESAGDYIDLLKLGFGTAFLNKKLDSKIKIYREAGMKVYFGGTFFEAYFVRGLFDDYCRILDKFKVDAVEISDGSIKLPHEEKCRIIKKLSGEFTVLSEVGSKEEGMIIHPRKWIDLMNHELNAGSWKVIAEARESGTVGIFRKSGNVHSILIDRIMNNVNTDKIIWEAPNKNQQVWFIKKFGANVNIGNVAPDDAVPLETLRLGLRGDTFFQFLPDQVTRKFKP
ncbi:MAG: phosphosulfolactate synthase [Bacteroidetes bacterium]|nr:phosphosulfolactate synthase [Bacteroidota bacterium]